MLNSMKLNDSPILHFINERYPHLPPEKKQKVFDLLQASGIPPTDKIFGWIVETALLRVEVSELSENLAQTDSNLAAHPLALQSSLVTVLKPYLTAAGDSKISSDALTGELRRAAVIDASIAESGWRGIGAALAAIFKHQNLLIVVGSLMLFSGLIGADLTWKLGASDRRILEQN